MKVRIETATHYAVCVLAVLGILVSLSFSGIVLRKTGMITPNAYSERVGKDVMNADVDECSAKGEAERVRLLRELVAGDKDLVGRAQGEATREATGGKVGEALAPDNASSAKKDVYGAVGAAAWDILFSKYDPDTVDEDMLAKDLGIESFTRGFATAQRLQDACLRAKGYRVKRNEKDGSGIAVLLRDPARVVLRNEDGTEVVFSAYLPPSRRGKKPEEAVKEEKP